MQSAVRIRTDPGQQELAASLPLYAGSLVVTLAGIGAVGVTISVAQWTPVWVTLVVLGHGFSMLLRRLRLPSEVVFYPVMLLGSAAVLQLSVLGSPLVGMDTGLFSLPTDMATAAAIGALAGVRCFTLVTNASLLFSPVPAITMLALVGSSNPNAEVPLFFGLLLLGSLFTTGYEAHLRRIAVSGRPPSPILFHLLSAWFVTLGVALAALLFPLALRPVLGPFSPFALPAVSQLNTLIDFTQVSSTQAPIGQGTINLSPEPMYEVYAPEGGLLRTDIFTTYSGRSWTAERYPNQVDIYSDERVTDPTPLPRIADLRVIPWSRYHFRLPPAPEGTDGAQTRQAHQIFLTRGRANEGIPGLGRIREVLYPGPTIFLNANGTVSGNRHGQPNRVFEVTSELVDFSPEHLRRAGAVDPNTFDEPDTLELPQSTLPVQELARSLAEEVPNAYDRVLRFIEYIEKNCRYTLEEDVTPSGEDAVVHYLFNTKRGACDLSASALAVMCRATGVPARIAVGYRAEEPLESGGGFLVRQHHAHMWVEVYFPERGWIAFDPAPALSEIRNNPLEVAWYRILGLISRIGGGGLDALLFLAVLLITVFLASYGAWMRWKRWLVRRRRERQAAAASPAGAVALLYTRALRLLGKRGWLREPWMTSREYLESIRGTWEDAPGPQSAFAALERLTACFERAHYAGDAGEPALRAASECLGDLARTAPRKRRQRRIAESA